MSCIPPMTPAKNPAGPPNTRRWQRYPVELPLRVATVEGHTKTIVPGLATEISRRGMTLYAGVPLEPGARMEVEFQTEGQVRLIGVVRNRTGFCFGVEFVAQTTNGNQVADDSEPVMTAPGPNGLVRAWPLSDVATVPGVKNAVSYSALCAGLTQAEEKVVSLLQRELAANKGQNAREIQRLGAGLVRIRELRRQIEELVRTS